MAAKTQKKSVKTRANDEGKNLTTPEEIIHAFLIKDSRHAISRFADKTRFSRPYISQHIHGHAHNVELLQEMANHLGCGVYGVMPKLGTSIEQRIEQ